MNDNINSLNKLKNLKIKVKKSNFINNKDNIEEEFEFNNKIIIKKIPLIDNEIVKKLKYIKIKKIYKNILINTSMKWFDQTFKQKIIKKFPLSNKMNEADLINNENHAKIPNMNFEKKNINYESLKRTSKEMKNDLLLKRKNYDFINKEWIYNILISMLYIKNLKDNDKILNIINDLNEKQNILINFNNYNNLYEISKKSENINIYKWRREIKNKSKWEIKIILLNFKSKLEKLLNNYSYKRFISFKELIDLFLNN